MDKIRVLLLDGGNEVKTEIQEILINVEYISIVGIVSNEKEAVKFIDNNTIDVILIDSGLDNEGYAITEKLSSEYPELAIIIIENELEEETIHKAFFAGAKDVIIKPIHSSQLINSIYKSSQQTKKKTNVQKSVNSKAKIKDKVGRIYTVFSTKGGVGKTFIATNLAILLAKKNKNERVVLVDLDVNYGNIALALNVLPRYTISDIVDDLRNIGNEDMEGYLTPHESGLWVLPANVHPTINEFINEEHISLILKTLERSFDYIIVDMPTRYDDIVRPAVAKAECIFMIVTPELSTIRNVKASLISLIQANNPRSKIKLIYNKAGGNGVKYKDIEKTLTSSIFATIATDNKHVLTAMNMGIPYVIKNPYSRITNDLKNIVKKAMYTK